jgi:DNA-binding winged helix-turn-helix (wHTH) protein
MDYYFNNFKFNGLSLLLTQNGQSLPIRNNEAKLLSFLLANPGQVYSKDAILEHVWAGKIVSEQAVFQAISNLRTLFGEDAIKTFPKRGYQWQIPLHADEPQYVDASATQIIQQDTHRYGLWPLALLGALCLAALMFFFTHKSPSLPEPTAILLAPFTLDKHLAGTPDIAGQLQDAFIEQASEHEQLAVTSLSSGDQPQQVALAPDYFFERHQSSTGAKLMVTGNIRQHEQTFYLSFVLQGRSNQWRGYLTGKNVQELARDLHSLLSKIASIKVFWEASDWRLIDAQLQVLHSENPDDLRIHYRLVENLFYLGDMDNAKIQAEALELRARQLGNIPYQSLALVIQMHAGFQSTTAEQKLALLDKAVALAASANDAILQSYVMERYAFAYYEQHNFTALEDKLLRALALAEFAPDRQLQVLHSLSVFSFNFNREDKRDEYLRRARALLDEYQLPGESYAQLDDIAGMYNHDNEQKEVFYRAAINRFKPEQEAWIKEAAQRHLVDLLLEEQRWADALAVLATEKILSGAELYMQASVYFNQHEMDLAQAKAEEAFKQANLQGEYRASLEAALLLAQIYLQINKPDLQKNMLDFIERNALEYWKQERSEQLKFLKGI